MTSFTTPRAGFRLAGPLLAATVLAAASGCEYFTSEQLEKFKPTTTTTTATTTAAPPKVESPAAPIVGEAQPTAASTPPTTADIVALLERIIRRNRDELAGLRDKLLARGESEGEQDRARDVFQTLDDLINGLKRERKKAEADGRADRIADVDRQLDALKTPWELARERLNLDLRGRSLMLERVEILSAVIAHDQGRLDAILATGDPSAVFDGPATPPPPTEPEPTPEPRPEPPPEPTPAPVGPPLLLPGLPATAQAPATDEAKDKAAEPKAEAGGETKTDEAKAAKPKIERPSRELVAARRELEVQSAAVQRLRQRSLTLDARIQDLARSLELLGQLAAVARLSQENAVQTRDYLIAEMKTGKPSVALQAWTKAADDPIAPMDQRIKEARENAERFEERRELMVEERGLVAGALQNIAEHSQTASETLEKAQEKVEALESPFSSHRILDWLRLNGPPILSTLAVMILLYLVVTRYSHKIIRIFAARGLRGSKAERDNRMETLVSVLKNTGGAVVLVGGVLTLLGQVGVPVGPLLGGAAVAGVAVAFGAQSLIKDFFYGFMILLENQYKLNDVVQIGEHSGQVEQITLRMTALRDMEGSLHFLPNGATTSVVNLTHGWSRALFSVRVGVGEDVDRVIAIIQELGKEIRQDPAFRLMIVDDLTMVGVDAMTESAVTLVFFIKTLPTQQWTVKREFLKRLKKKFDQNAVILPPPFVMNPPPGA